MKQFYVTGLTGHGRKSYIGIYQAESETDAIQRAKDDGFKPVNALELHDNDGSEDTKATRDALASKFFM